MTLALKLLLREVRNGDVLTLFFALILSVSTVTGIGVFVDRLQMSFDQQSATLLAADRLVRSNTPIEQAWLEQANVLNLQTAQRVSFSSMVFSDTRLQLSQISAVTQLYPLRGDYLVDDVSFGAGYAYKGSPNPGEIWISSRLASLLGVTIGDRLQVGERDVTVSRFLVRDPGSSGSAFAIAPRAVMNLEDLAATEVIQPGSRVSYNLLLAGNERDLKAFEDWISPKLNSSQRWRTPREGGQGINAAIGRAESFLLLAGTLAVVMSGVAMALASARYVKRHLTQVAVMKTLGATPTKVAKILLMQLLVVFILGTGVGLSLGWLAQELIALSLASLFATQLPEASILNLWLGTVTGFMSLMAFCLPLLMRLFAVSPLTVLQPAAQLQMRSAAVYVAALVGMFGLMVIYTGGVLLPSIMTVAVAFVGALVGLIGLGLFTLGRRLTSGATSGWQIGLASLHRRLITNLFQLLVFTLIIMLGLILLGVKSNLISDWQRQLPDNAPNHYLFNVQSDQVEPISRLAQTLDVPSSEWYPMVRGRVTHLNGVAAEQLFPEGKDEPEIFERELNLTWTTSLAADNVVVAGEFAAHIEGLSIEARAAEEVNVTLGDELTLMIGGNEYVLPITSIRTVDWGSMRPNFYLILPQSILADFPANYISSLYLMPERMREFYQGMAEFPTVSIINVGDLVLQIQAIIQQVSQAIQLVLGFILASGALVLVASVRASLDERLEEGALLRTLGASRMLVRQAMLVEFGFLGFAAGLIAAAAAELSLYGLQVFVFQLAPTWHASMWILGPVSGFIVVTGVGLYAGKSVLSVPPMRMLRGL